ncbi:MAG: hypothetical protein CYG59_22990 [Chloroflexi bacterium]|nr:MAG: hypothetical protein CYG59_22990 [Chloroflexota bacterium]
MAVRVSTAWTYHGLNAIMLDNTLLRVILLPQLGGEIWQITYKPTDEIYYGGWRNLSTMNLGTVHWLSGKSCGRRA